MHDELQKALGNAKINKVIRIDKIPNKILKNETHDPGLYAAY